jgi:DNA-binding FadR family transcriptional regulator
VTDDRTVLPKIRNVPSYQEVYNIVEGEILARRLKLGDKLPSETELAEMLGVNRSTVREGIRLLEQTGLVRRRQGRRLYVSRPRYAELSTRMSRAMIMHQIVFREVLELLEVLEPLAARLAAKRIDAEQLELLEANVLTTETAVADGKPLVDHDIKFHALVVEAAGNRALSMAREPVGLLLFPAFDRVTRPVRQAPRRLAEAHRAILEAIRRRDADEAELWMKRHIADFRRGCDIAGLDGDEVVDALGG